jgi:protein tyrosine phosphatase (PTP) superfamily phosphohydrolase (DUF442 family)
MRRRALLVLGLSAPAAALAQALPNRVDISPQLVTSGQPGAAALAGLQAQGFDAVIYLAPSNVHDAVRDEAAIVQRQGLAWIHLPVRFGEPREADFHALVAALRGQHGRKVLVHCQVNMRASSLVFLYRTIELKEPPERAYEAVARIWSPDDVWKRYLVTMLRKHGIGFDPY